MHAITDHLTEGLRKQILAEIDGVIALVDDALESLAMTLRNAERIFVTGEGRSGLMAKAFAMRLMHLGLPVHVIGETTTPAVAQGDTARAPSGSPNRPCGQAPVCMR
ncbi:MULTISPECIES: hypothetical protein [Streptomyces]|uniref:SIS domain-containing protein n=1 Tax=Streptomyces dengpaensis TaxID=2049881 RepID=A0ABM6SJX3_9ACTN|nr:MULTISPECIES: hypothetical protein [Streptomyces]AVH54882.1 hypothetical protein C4B68_02680 [Streptomyces dengpaensis]PIB00283.1 hypothetical protein B1C81_38745 [Streptomyces sp. HG99]